MKKLILLLLMISLSSLNSYSQEFQFDCGTVEPESGADNSIANPFVGVFKPVRTDLNGDSIAPSNAYLPVIIVFVQFKNDINLSDWPSNQPPIYLDSLIADEKNSQTQWWDAYDENTQSFSDLYMELSRGKMHVLGRSFSIVLSKEASEYTTESSINIEIWDSLNAKIPDWKPYDLWKKGSGGKFLFQKDHFVDMIFKIHKSRNSAMTTYAGYAKLAWGGQNNYLVDSDDTIYVDHGFGETGSGITLIYAGKKNDYIGTVKHEFGHYLITHGGHYTYSAVSYGIGYEGFYSPYEMILCNYMKTNDCDFNNVTWDLGDYTSRNSDSIGNILKVPIQNNEFFLLVNRQKVSKWEKIMLGDTALKLQAYNDNTNYEGGYTFIILKMEYM